MNSVFNHNSHEIDDKFSSLKKSVDKIKDNAIKKRIAKKSNASNLEYLLGAFMEMYEPHLKIIVHKLFKKGYAIDASSGFGGKHAEFQAMTGDFSIDYVTKNKLEKIGAKFREYNRSKSLIFWPEKSTLDDVLNKWMQIVDALPDKGVLKDPSTSADAVAFRRKYIPQDLILQSQRLFERLKYKIQSKMEIEIKRRKTRNPHPTKIELMLGLFIEEIEPQVRQAIIAMNEKGYSTDKSGFMDNPCDQMIEGDFQLDEDTISKLEAVGVLVETNPSGYTRMQVSPPDPDIAKMKRQWKKIISILPNKKQTASISMTRQARDFRMEYK